MKKSPQDESRSLLSDNFTDTSKNRDEKGPVVFNGERPHEANYGISPKNTSQVTGTAKKPIKVKVKVRQPVFPAQDNTENLMTAEHPDGEKENNVTVPPIALEKKALVSAPQKNQHNETASLTVRKLPRKEWLIFLSSVLGTVLLAALVFAVMHLGAKPIVKQDINTICGCPEFYGLEWGMTIDEAESSIELKHQTIKDDAPDSMEDSAIIIDEEEAFYLYGLKTTDIYISFDGEYLDSVMFTFEKKSNTFKQIVTLYTKIYGFATDEFSSFSTWEGPQTTIDVFDYELISDDQEKIIAVRYSITENNQFKVLSFDGPETDPCSFLGDNYVFDKKPSYYTDGLKKDDDYTYQSFSMEGFPGFEIYTLYPQFEYMGIGKGYTAIEFNVGDDENTVDVASYIFFLEKTNTADRIDYIKRGLDSAYGQHKSCDYTSLLYSELGIVDLSFDEFKTKVANGTQGIYHIQWVSNGINITLGLTIDPNKTYYEGSVAFSEQPPHEHAYTIKNETAPTCEKDGAVEYVCSCGSAYSETKAATGHAYSSATCTQPNICSICGKTDGVPLGHLLVDCVCSRCGIVEITIDNLQGTWLFTYDDGNYMKMRISGSSATVEETNYDGSIIYWNGSVQLNSQGFQITGTYQGTMHNGEPYSATRILHCYVSKITQTYIVDTFWDGTWYKQ